MDVFVWLGFVFVLAVLAVVLREDVGFAGRPTATARGTVFGHYKSTSDGSDTYSIQFRFAAADGRQIEVTDTLGRAAPQPPVGAEVPIVYPLAEPEKVRVRRPLLRAFIYLVLVGMLGLLGLRLLGFVH